MAAQYIRDVLHYVRCQRLTLSVRSLCWYDPGYLWLVLMTRTAKQYRLCCAVICTHVILVAVHYLFVKFVLSEDDIKLFPIYIYSC
jgi:hypothetical protein